MSDTAILAERLSRSDRAYGRLLFSLLVLLCLSFAASLSVGPAAIGFDTFLHALFLGTQKETEAAVLIMREIRLPRAILGLLIGAALGLSGAALQGYLRNPLAEPGLIGVSAGAALGAVVTINIGLTSAFALALPLGGIVGAFAAVLLVHALAGVKGGPLTLILAGVAVTSFAGALMSLALNLSSNPFAALEIVFWMLGSLADRSMVHVHLAAPMIVPGIIMLLLLGRALSPPHWRRWILCNLRIAR